MRHASFEELERRLHSRVGLLDTGMTDHAIAAQLASGVVHRVRRGWYVDRTLWDQLWPESRHLAHVITVARDARGATLVFSHASAAVLWGIPLYRLRLLRVHVLMGDSRRCSAPDLQRHEGALDADDIVVRHGLLCTSLDRTVADLARTIPLEAGLAAADAALSRLTGGARDYDAVRAQQWRDLMTERVSVPGARGVRVARRVVGLADGRAELPGESVSRLQLLRLGFATPRLQVPVPAPRGRYFIDFALDDANAFGEFDGKGKYTDLALRSGRTLEQVLLDEKSREDWIRGREQRRFARWGDEHSRTPDDLGRRLAVFGIRPPRE